MILKLPHDGKLFISPRSTHWHEQIFILVIMSSWPRQCVHVLRSTSQQQENTFIRKRTCRNVLGIHVCTRIKSTRSWEYTWQCRHPLSYGILFMLAHLMLVHSTLVLMLYFWTPREEVKPSISCVSSPLCVLYHSSSLWRFFSLLFVPLSYFMLSVVHSSMVSEPEVFTSFRRRPRVHLDGVVLMCF